MDWPCSRLTPLPVSRPGDSAALPPGRLEQGRPSVDRRLPAYWDRSYPDQGEGMSRDVAEGHQVGGRSWVFSTRPETPIRPPSVWARTVELLDRRHGECLELEARIRRARRELGSTRSDGLQQVLVEIEVDLGTYARLLAEREARLGWAGPLPLPRGGGGSSDDGVPLGAAITEFARRSRGDVLEAERLADPESAGVLAEIARVAETWLWGLRTGPDDVRMSRQPCSEPM
jgi:hypothetical protein